MLVPFSLRICCLAVMAPALTEAATQAQQNFKLPPSPVSSSSNSNPSSPLGNSTEKYICDELNELSKSKVDLYSLLISNRTDNSICYQKTADDSYRLARPEDNSYTLSDKMNKPDSSLQSNDNMGIQRASAKLALESHPRLEMDAKDIMVVDTPASSPYSSSLDNSLVENVKKADEVTQLMSIPKTSKSTRPLTAATSQIIKRNMAIDKRTERLMHRLQKLQFIQCEKHVNEQLTSFLEHQQKGMFMDCPMGCHDSPPVSSAKLLHSEDMKNMSTAALVSLVRKLEAKNGPSVFKPRSNYSSLEIGTNPYKTEDVLNHDKIRIKSEGPCVHTEKNTKLTADKSMEIRRVSGTIAKNLRILENAIDSDATDSSSGGESCDELDGYSGQDQIPLKTIPIHKRAAWKWAVDRAAVASRWTWLQAQISDLEYRIRKQSEIVKKLREPKTEFVLREYDYLNECCELCFYAVDFGSKCVNPSTHAQRTMHPDQENRVLGRFTCEHGKIIDHNDVRTCFASRIKPLKNNFMKRKLLRTSDIHQINCKSPRKNIVRCRCLPHTQCALCGGRYGNMQPIEVDYSNIDERIAYVDPSYHPILSFKQDISLPVRFEKLLKGGEWQKVNHKSHPLIKKKSNLTLNNHARSHSKKLAKSAAAQLLTSAKLRKKLGEKKHGRGTIPAKNGASLRKKRAAKIALAFKKHHLLERGSFQTSSGSSSKAGSPIPSPAPPDMYSTGNAAHGFGLLSDAARKRRESAYDIDNIVIPYSMTASTRIEKLQYKEIITPKWRLLDEHETSDSSSKEVICKNNGLIIPAENIKQEEVEDISDELFIAKHAICEASEKKRFLCVLNNPSGRSRARVTRFDSRADSSGANTPDPLSPHVVDQLITDQLSPITSPVTPSMQSDDSMPATPNLIGHHTVANARPHEHKRSNSLSGKDVGTDSLPEWEGPFVMPFEPRTFPLDDAEYDKLLQVCSQPTNSNILARELMSPPTGFPIMARLESNLSRPATPDLASSPSETTVEEIEDPNDPEWTVISNEKAVQRHPAIVLKLTKR